MSDVTVKGGTREWAVVQAMRGCAVEHQHMGELTIFRDADQVLDCFGADDGWELYEEPESEIPRGTIVQFADGMLGHYLRHENGLYWAARDSWNHDDMAYQDRPTPLTCSQCGAAYAPLVTP